MNERVITIKVDINGNVVPKKKRKPLQTVIWGCRMSKELCAKAKRVGAARIREMIEQASE